MSEEDHVNIMLPHHYQAFDEVEGLMMEVEKPMIQTNSSCRNPVIIVDTSGMCGKHLVFVKAALKRVLYAQMQTKDPESRDKPFMPLPVPRYLRWTFE